MFLLSFYDFFIAFIISHNFNYTMFFQLFFLIFFDSFPFFAQSLDNFPDPVYNGKEFNILNEKGVL